MCAASKTAPAAGASTGRLLMGIYNSLFARYGPQHWWPGETPFEVMVGAVLTQSCAWTNVEKGIRALQETGRLAPAALRGTSLEVIASLIHSCGYYNVKARKLRALVNWLGEYCGDDIGALAAVATPFLRTALLAVYGIGEETADSILLYACDRPVFVIDAYTRRIMTRYGLSRAVKNYAACQAIFTDNLTPDAALFNEYHALLVRLGKEICRQRPQCSVCPLSELCASARRVTPVG